MHTSRTLANFVGGLFLSHAALAPDFDKEYVKCEMKDHKDDKENGKTMQQALDPDVNAARQAGSPPIHRYRCRLAVRMLSGPSHAGTPCPVGWTR